MNIKKFLVGTVAGALMLSVLVVPAFAKTLGAAVKNENANPNACWGMDRAFYASEGFFPKNMDIKQSFPPAYGKVGEQRAAWVATYCDPHGPVVTPPPVCVYGFVPTGIAYDGEVLYGSTVTPVTVTNVDCSTVNALKVEHTQNFSQGQTTGVSAGWAGWSCVQPGYLDAIGGGVIPETGTFIAQGLAESGAPAIDGYNYPFYPHYTFGSGEEGWVVEAAGPTPPTSTYVLCGPTL